MTGPVRPAMEGLRVLVVEDDDDLRTLLSANLRRLGCVVVDVSRGEDAMSAARRFAPQVAVVDLRLGGISGTEVIGLLRADAVTAACRIVVTSVLDAADYPPADAALPKPFSRRQIEDVLLVCVGVGVGG